ncbi:oxidoreductase [Streptomyces sp. NPDC048436]|uniref:oxidoreductase n=1 Tax=Streptomyces sp. NPDC048436 TaxID=3365550 RepID=UPI00371D8872
MSKKPSTSKTLNSRTTAATAVKWTEELMPDQSGRLVVVTGGNSGIGYVTARELARRGAHTVLACRDRTRAEAAVLRMRTEVPGVRVESRPLDLADLKSVRRFAENWDHERLDLLINNAAMVMPPLTRTVDGFESQFGVNHLGAYALTGRLLPYLLRAPEPRVVTVSSEGQLTARFSLDNLNGERRYNPSLAYAQSKRANVYFSAQLHRWATAERLPLRSMIAIPGLSDTGVITKNSVHGPLWRAVAPRFIRLLAKPVIQGARPSLYAATVPGLPGGSYIAPKGKLQMRGAPTPRHGRRTSYDEETAVALWELSERLTGVRYGR